MGIVNLSSNQYDRAGLYMTLAGVAFAGMTVAGIALKGPMAVVVLCISWSVTFFSLSLLMQAKQEIARLRAEE